MYGWICVHISRLVPCHDIKDKEKIKNLPRWGGKLIHREKYLLRKIG